MQRYHLGQYGDLLSGIINSMNTSHQPNKVFGEKVRALRQRLGLSQAELSEALRQVDPSAGVGQSQVSTLENGGSLPSVMGLRALAIALETNTDYLLGLTDDDRPPAILDDQVIATVTDKEERTLIQDALDVLARADHAEKLYVVDLIHRLIPRKTKPVGSV